MTVEPFTYTRVVDAPRKITFLAYTDPVHLARFLGPAGSRIVRGDMDLRPGGSYHYGLVTADGVEMWGLQQYREVVRDEKLVHLQSFSDPDRGLARHPLAATWPRWMLATTTFEDDGPGRTKITVSWAPFEADATEEATFDAARDGMRGGFGGMFDTLDRYLAETEAEITHSRLVDAPRAAVWRAYTDPAEVNAWWGPDGFRNVDVAQDVRVGGVWSFTMVGPDGARYKNHSRYVELTEPTRIVYDHGDGTHVLFRATITFVEEAGKTRVVSSSRFASRAKRDVVVPFAIDGGLQHLAKLEARLAARPA
jgi:uncharacterized protein YndB with AHSA1/START domain